MKGQQRRLPLALAAYLKFARAVHCKLLLLNLKRNGVIDNHAVVDIAIGRRGEGTGGVQ